MQFTMRLFSDMHEQCFFFVVFFAFLAFRHRQTKTNQVTEKWTSLFNEMKLISCRLYSTVAHEQWWESETFLVLNESFCAVLRFIAWIISLSTPFIARVYRAGQKKKKKERKHSIIHLRIKIMKFVNVMDKIKVLKAIQAKKQIRSKDPALQLYSASATGWNCYYLLD